jgi:uncharacterized protein (TIGR02301 family)
MEGNFAPCKTGGLPPKKDMIHRTIFTLCAVVALSCAAPQRPAAAELSYTGKLYRLAEILGSLHFLRNLCGEKGDTWRNEMEKIIQAENPESASKARLIATFNRGYRTFNSVYSECTPAALDAIDKYMKEGKALSEGITGQFGN